VITSLSVKVSALGTVLRAAGVDTWAHAGAAVACAACVSMGMASAATPDAQHAFNIRSVIAAVTTQLQHTAVDTGVIKAGTGSPAVQPAARTTAEFREFIAAMWGPILITILAASGNNIGKVLQKQATRSLPKLVLKKEVITAYLSSRIW
jgi:hypothetical protein